MPGRSFQKGNKFGGKRANAGRPKGVPNKVNRELAEAAREYTAEALKVFVNTIRAKNATRAEKMAAADHILNRGHGRPFQAVRHTGANGGPIAYADLSKLTSEQLEQLESILAPLAGAGDDAASDQGREGPSTR